MDNAKYYLTAAGLAGLAIAWVVFGSWLGYTLLPPVDGDHFMAGFGGFILAVLFLVATICGGQELRDKDKENRKAIKAAVDKEMEREKSRQAEADRKATKDKRREKYEGYKSPTHDEQFIEEIRGHR